MTHTLELNCLVLDSHASINRIFTVHILETDNVATLKEKIKEKKPATFQHIATNALKLWIVSAPIEQLLETDLHDLQPAHAPLLPVKRLGNLYLDAPLEEHLHIIVQPPPGIADVPSKLFILYDISYFLQLLPIHNPFLSWIA